MTDDATLQTIADAGWTFPEEVWRKLSDYERSFAALEFSGQKTPTYYAARLRAIGFCQLDRILDAACGMGQWSLAMAGLNGHVEGIDINAGRLDVAAALARAAGRTNCSLRSAPMEQLPYDDAEFDAVFCYGAFMFADMPRALAEFRRVLRPGGRVYLNANSSGWYAHLLIDRGLAKANLRIIRSAAFMIVQTLLRRSRNRVVGMRWLGRRLGAAGFRVVANGAEGTICLDEQPDQPRPDAAYPRSFYGLPAVIEVLAQKER